jgi:predicted phage terminase large subunit-like protein
MPDTLESLISRLRQQGATRAQVIEAIRGLPEHVVATLLSDSGGSVAKVPASPLAQARELDAKYIARPHLEYLDRRLTIAAEKMSDGISQRLAVSMPPRMGKSTLISQFGPLWFLRRDPTTKIGLISHSPTLVVGWARTVRNVIENNPGLGLAVAPDAGAASEWETTQGGGVTARSVGQSIVGRGFKVIIVDDVVRDYATAHSDAYRQAVWDWWTANAYTRLEPPFMIIAVGTRWHEDDFIGRLLSPEHEGNPDDWDVVSFPALAEENDVLGRAEGEPLLSPLLPRETITLALERWAETKTAVGGYNWDSQYQQRPSAPQGAIFNVGWFRYWTTKPHLATPDGKVRLVDFDAMVGTRWIDSWDMAFKATDTSDWVVGQRWAMHGANRYLFSQTRGRWDFVQTLGAVEAFKAEEHGELAFTTLIEEKANGAAVISVLRDKIAGLKPVNPKDSKEARAAAVTPEVESGNVYLPLPAEFPWVADLISELRAFPTGAHDDQVDTLSQALNHLRVPAVGRVSSLTDRPPIGASRLASARSMPSRLGR